MFLAEILNRTQFENLSTYQIAEFTLALSIIYNDGNGPGADLLNHVMDTNSILKINPEADGPRAGQGPHARVAGFQVYMNTMNSIGYIDQSGTIRQMDLVEILTHELVHAIYGKVDPESEDSFNNDFSKENPDYAGDTVRLTNDILASLKIYNVDGSSTPRYENFRVSYSGASPAFYHEAGKILVGLGHVVHTTLLAGDNGTPYGNIGLNPDTSKNTQFDLINDLIIGDVNSNEIRSGLGLDYLYGAFGDDTLIGGAGNDFLHGGMGDDWSSYVTKPGDASGMYSSGIDVDWTVDYQTIVEQFGGIDTLQFIENVQGTGFDDIFAISGDIDQIASLFSQTYTGLVSFNADGTTSNEQSGDTIVVNSSQGAVVDLAVEELSSSTPGGKSIKIIGFENVTGSAHNDTITGDDSANILKGNAGADELRGNGGDDVIIFDADDTVVDGGEGRDVGVFQGEGAVDMDLSDHGLEVLIAGNGADEIYLKGDGLLMAAGGAGNDRIVVEYAQGQGARIVWGGAGSDAIQLQATYADGIEWNEQAGILVVQVEGLSEANFAGLTVEGLGLEGIDLSQIDVIVLNPDAGDVISVNGQELYLAHYEETLNGPVQMGRLVQGESTFLGRNLAVQTVNQTQFMPTGYVVSSSENGQSSGTRAFGYDLETFSFVELGEGELPTGDLLWREEYRYFVDGTEIEVVSTTESYFEVTEGSFGRAEQEGVEFWSWFVAGGMTDGVGLASNGGLTATAPPNASWWPELLAA